MNISIKNLNKSYNGKQVLKDFSYEFPATGIVSVIGASGCGKTTLINIILGLIKPDSGIVSGVDRKNIACVFQEDRLIPQSTLYENVKIVTDKDNGALCDKWISNMYLSEDKHKYPRELSGGMKRRCSLARAMVRKESGKCGLLIMDEPFKGLDDELKEKVIYNVKKDVDNVLMIFITHDMKEAEMLSDEIISMKGVQNA